MNGIFNHLWQSTVFAAAVAVACMALRSNAPRLRYWLWLASSLKFLVPFSLFVSLGGRIQIPPDTPSVQAARVEQISTYFAPVTVSPAAVAARGPFHWDAVLGAIWFAGAIFLLVRWIGRWYRIRLGARRATRLPLGDMFPIFSSPLTMEPGAFGIFRPVILLPDGIADNLTPEQLDAVLAHESRHIRCRDNLTAALHMCVETLFWFYPLVWWIGAKLIDERERDCDEAVLRLGGRPRDYAEGVIHVCRTYVESPLACAAGISGSDLKKRIRGIMTWRASLPMTLRGRVLLSVAAVAIVSVPFGIGIIRAQSLPPAPQYGYEVVSIHRSAREESRDVHVVGPQGGLRIVNMSVMIMLAWSYEVPQYRFVDAPGWAFSERYDVVLTPDTPEISPGPDTPAKDALASMGRNQQRLRAVLRDRFGLVLRAERRELPIYALVPAKGGSKITTVAGDHAATFHGPRGHLAAERSPISLLINYLGIELGRPVSDETGLDGLYTYKLDWIPQLDSGDAAPDGPSIFTALTEQLGLRLESKKGPVPIYVIEKIARPAEN